LTKTTLRVKDGDSLRMGIWVLVFDHTAWPFTDDSTAGHQHSTAALVVECVFQPIVTAFQSDRGRRFSGIVDDGGGAQVIF
jgi:hypothetical protein